MGDSLNEKGQFTIMAVKAFTGLIVLMVTLPLMDAGLDVLFPLIDNFNNLSNTTAMQLFLGLLGFILVLLYLFDVISPLIERFDRGREPRRF